MTYTQLYSLAGAEPAPLPEGVSAAEAEALGYLIVAPQPGVAEGEEAFWTGHAWAARPAAPAAEGESA